MTHSMESLESRTLFAAGPLAASAEVVNDLLEVNGTNKSDEIHVAANVEDAAAIDVTVNGVLLGTFTATGINVQAGNGSDVVTIDASVSLPTSILGGNGSDTLHGGAGADTMDGGNGKDQLFGNLGNDVLRGGKGKDTLDGGDGDDELTGGKGRDSVLGGLGADLFQGDVLIEILDLEEGETVTEKLRGGGRKSA